MEGKCQVCKTVDDLINYSCGQCSKKVAYCVDCSLTYKCNHTIDVDEKLKTEDELLVYMFFQPQEGEMQGILDTEGLQNEVLLVSKKTPKHAGFNYPFLISQIPIDKIPYYYSASCQLGPNHYILMGGLEVETETVFYSLKSGFIVEGNLGFWELNPIPQLKTARHCHQLVKLGERLYVLGGISKEATSTELKFLSDCEYLDIPKLLEKVTTGKYPLVDEGVSKWTSIAPMNFRRAQFGSFEHGGTIYVFGGYSGTQAQVNSIERYVVSENKWELIKDVKLGDKVLNPFLAESLCLRGTNPDEIYILGGTDGKKRSKAVYAYNAKENKIDQIAELKKERSGAHGYSDENTLYIFGGDSGDLSIERIRLIDGTATVKFIEPEFEGPVDSVNFEGIQGFFFGTFKTQAESN